MKTKVECPVCGWRGEEEICPRCDFPLEKYREILSGGPVDYDESLIEEFESLIEEFEIDVQKHKKIYEERSAGGLEGGQKLFPNYETQFNYVKLEQEGTEISEEPSIVSREIKFDEIAERLKLIITERNITESDKLNTIRERISKWSNSIPYHDFVDLGNKIELISVKEKPSYIVTLQTQYEKRELKHGIRPYLGEKIPPKSIDDRNVNIWAFQVPLVEDFREEEKNYIITESQEVSKCGKCKGKGEVVCYFCRGAGVKTCSHCSGSGEVRCSSCGGSGGSWIEGKYYPCSDCRNGYKNCRYCGGRGQVTCRTCNGLRMLTCNNCQGWGEVVTYLYFTDIFKPILRMEIVNHPDLPKEIVSGESIHIYHEGKETIKEQEGNIILEIIQKIITEDVLEPLTHISLKNTVSQLIFSSREAREMGIIGRDCRILKQKLTINQINALQIDYRYSNKTYSMWLYGKENALLFAPVSPISEVCDNYYVSAQDLFRKKEYSQALDLIEKVCCMQPKREEAKKLKDTIINKIGLQYVIGGVSGGIISGTITGSILSLLIKPHLGLDEALIGGLVCGMIIGIIGIIIGEVFRSIFSVKIRESKKRFFYPFWTTVVFAILSGIGFYFFGKEAITSFLNHL